MIQILEHNQQVLTLRARPIGTWIYAAIFLPLYSVGAVLWIYVVIASIFTGGFNLWLIFLLGLMAMGWGFMFADMWVRTQVTVCSFNKTLGVATFTFHGIRTKTITLPLNDIFLVGVETCEGTVYRRTVTQSRPYIQAQGGKVIPLSANYIGSRKSVEIEGLVQAFLDRSKGRFSKSPIA
ncbi:hypothetical protein C7B61_01910 [filamentous cyanobacterium CCP1]|nr:hypothetical protein C7B76_06080 [filamentous cyanobacterium CCP2]PSB68234.1 hypothetical protein C7B61_01910 [filamentous cyanobacterium CCP1]